MIRRLQVTITPSGALTALSTLHHPPDDLLASPGVSSATAVFGARFGQEVGRAFEAESRALDVFAQCAEWLERRGVAVVVRARSRAGARVFTWACAMELRVDVRELSRELVAEREEVDSRARASAWALRMVLRHLAEKALHASEVKVGGERVPAVEALAAYDAEMSRAGFGPHAAPPLRLAHLVKRGARREEAAVVTEAPATKVAAPRPESADKRPEAAAVHDARPRGGVKGRRVDAATEKRAAPKAPGFGGLPDDATPDDRRTGDVFSVRGLTLDAEFFLTEAGIAEWPCEVASLERGRRAVAARLHPDRAGEASTTAFHRAIKGHAELLKKVVAKAAAPTATATVHEWPPRAPTATVSQVVPARRRRSA